MNAVLAFPFIGSTTGGVLQRADEVAHLNEQDKAALAACVLEFRLCQQRVGHELCVMTQQLVKIKLLVGEGFEQFVMNELGISKRSANRYLQLHGVMQNHFSVNGQINVAQASQLTQNALRLLSSDIPEDVITEIRELADKGGKKLDEATVRQIIQSRESDLESELAGVKAEVQAKDAELERVRNDSTLKMARLQNELSRHEELARRASEHKSALELEIKELTEKETIVSEKIVEKEVPPAGYASTIEAINKANELLEESKKKQQQVEEEIAEMNRKGAAIKAQIAELEGGAEEFIHLKSQLDSIMLKYPMVRLQAMSSIDDKIKSTMNMLGMAMADLGQQLQSAAALK